MSSIFERKASPIWENKTDMLWTILAVESDEVEEVVLEEFDPSYHGRSQRNGGRGQAYDDDDEEEEGQGGGVRCQQQ